MQPIPNTTELAELQLRLRSDLDFAMQEYGGEQFYIVEDRSNSRFYQIGLSEYLFISLLDGKTTIAEAIRLTTARLGQNAFTEQNAISIVQWLVESQLVTTAESTETQRLMDRASKNKRQAQASRLNPLLLKVPLFNPEQVLDALTPWFGWMTTKAAIVGWFGLCVLAVQQLVVKADNLGLTANGVLDRSNWFWLATTWIALKLFHELGHALTCRRFGGHVRDCGVMLILLAPIPYVDVTSSWRFPSKWQRIAVSGAGMFVELGLAAAATLVWSFSENELVGHHAYNVMLLGSVTTVAFNANFLMRFDGYYILSDWLEIPNLYSLGQQYLSYFSRRYLLGVQLDVPRWRGILAIKVYGVASLAWRVFICVCLVIAAEAILFGFGLLLSIAAVALWLAVPSVKCFAYLFRGKNNERPRWTRVVPVTLAAIAFVAASFTIIPWPLRVSAPAIVQYRAPEVVYVQAPGTVKRIHVEAGQQVKQGDLLVTLENLELVSQFRELELTIQQSEVRRRAYHLAQELGAYQAEASSLDSMRKQAESLRSQLASLEIRATKPGHIIGRDLLSLSGRYVSRGSHLLTIADEQEKEIVLSVHQDDVQQFRSQVGQPLMVCFIPHRTLNCRLARIDPRATSKISHEALIAPAFGQIPVQEDVTSDSDDVPYRYLHPRFEATISLPRREARTIPSGCRAQVKLFEKERRLGRHLFLSVRDWFRARLI